MQEELEQRYMTVGELAEKVGVTVRTIQYYDQENLLKPSAKGNRNQRLYTEKDEATLYKILCFKFMGLSITEIRESLDAFEQTDTVKELLEQKIIDVEKEMSVLMKRFATLKNLYETVKSDSEINWQHYAHMIERFQDEGKYIWQLNCSFEENAYREQNETKNREQQSIPDLERKKTIEQFHKLVAESIQLIHQNEPSDSPKCQDIAKRYLMMQEQFGFDISKSKHHDVVISDSTESSMQDSFSTLRQEVTTFIQEAVAIYYDSQSNKK